MFRVVQKSIPKLCLLFTLLLLKSTPWIYIITEAGNDNLDQIIFILISDDKTYISVHFISETQFWSRV